MICYTVAFQEKKVESESTKKRSALLTKTKKAQKIQVEKTLSFLPFFFLANDTNFSIFLVIIDGYLLFIDERCTIYALIQQIMRLYNRCQTLKKQPVSYNCFVCGRKSPVGLKMDFYTTGDGEVMAEFVVPQEYQGYPGIVHGGITAAMLDETAGRVGFSQDNYCFFMTMKLEVKYRKPIPTETLLRITGRLKTRHGGRVKAHSEIVLPDGQVAAEAEVLLAEMPDQMLEGVDLEALGWKICDE